MLPSKGSLSWWFIKISEASGQVAWERYLKEMNRERGLQDGNYSLNELQSFNFSNQTKEKLNLLKDWIESHVTVEVSKYTWVGGDFLSISPAEVFQYQLSEMYVDAPDVFETQEEKENFDKDFWRILMKSFAAEELGELFDTGSSNGHPLRLQILVLPKDTVYKLHAHPNIELIIGMQV